MTRATKPATTQARLSSIIKESRNIMRKDAGLNGELDRLPQMAWLLFLKAYDDLEEGRVLEDREHKPALDENYRWSNWAAGDLTGEPLLRFVNDKLLPYLRGLQGSGYAGDPKDALARVFQETRNRMLSGHLLRALVDQLGQIEFTNSDDIHTMAHFYESMLREMRDAAGDSGEFYTPRPLVRFIVDMVDPQPGDTVLDPAAGTGGFLVEAFEHMTEGNIDAKQLQQVKTGLRGVEKKPLPFLLCQMNLLLHGIDRPDVAQTNSLAQPLADVRRAGVDVVLTNPPFGGEEEASVQTNFTSALRTAETVWLFLQSVMARLEMSRTARCGIVVPNSVLFDTGVGGKIKKRLMGGFNLHTVLRLPNGVFAPYTPIPSNALFFERGPQAEHVWFYEHPLPAGRKGYTKTKPLAFDEFAECAQWWGGATREGREETEHAWRASTKSIVASGYNLDLRNPHVPTDLTHRPPTELVAELIEVERELLAMLEKVQAELGAVEL